jgi:hypothetical protein
MSEGRPRGESPSYAEVLVRDPLSPVTRRERLFLLAVRAVGIFVEYTGLVPTRVSPLGIELGRTNQNALLYVHALIIAYFLVAFVVYAAADFLARRGPSSAFKI